MTSGVFTARGYAKRGICRRRVSVCLSVTLWYCIKTAKRRITQTMPHDRVFKWDVLYRISTDKCLVRSLCNSRASCHSHNGPCRWLSCVFIRKLREDIIQAGETTLLDSWNYCKFYSRLKTDNLCKWSHFELHTRGEVCHERNENATVNFCNIAIQLITYLHLDGRITTAIL